jgi:hypothetical protein
MCEENQGREGCGRCVSAVTSSPPQEPRFAMGLQWTRGVMVAALALCLGIAGPVWAQLADPMAEDYAAHVIPFYKIDAN